MVSSSSDTHLSADHDGDLVFSVKRPQSVTSSIFSLVGLGALLMVVFVGVASAQDLAITSPAEGECISGVFTVDSPLEGGIINGNNFAPDPVSIDFSYTDNSGNFLDIVVTTSEVIPSFRQPPPALCPDWNFGADAVAACNGQGYCNFTRTCICFDNNDCDGGAGFCTSDQVCGCSNDCNVLLFLSYQH